MPVGSSSDHNHECQLRLIDRRHSYDTEELTQHETVGHSNHILYFVRMAESSIGLPDPSFLLELDNYYNTEPPEAVDRFRVHIHIGVAAMEVVQLETNC